MSLNFTGSKAGPVGLRFWVEKTGFRGFRVTLQIPGVGEHKAQSGQCNVTIDEDA